MCLAPAYFFIMIATEYIIISFYAACSFGVGIVKLGYISILFWVHTLFNPSPMYAPQIYGGMGWYKLSANSRPYALFDSCKCMRQLLASDCVSWDVLPLVLCKYVWIKTHKKRFSHRISLRVESLSLPYIKWNEVRDRKPVERGCVKTTEL